MHRLAYLSKNEIESDPVILKNEIQEILTISRVNNSRHGVTGALMYNATCFAQVLEGPQDAVSATYERIQCDPRHSNVVILDYSAVDERLFAQWSMGYLGVESDASREFDRLTENIGADPAKLKSDQIFNLLQQHMLEAETA